MQLWPARLTYFFCDRSGLEFAFVSFPGFRAKGSYKRFLQTLHTCSEAQNST